MNRFAPALRAYSDGLERAAHVDSKYVGGAVRERSPGPALCQVDDGITGARPGRRRVAGREIAVDPADARDVAERRTSRTTAETRAPVATSRGSACVPMNPLAPTNRID